MNIVIVGLVIVFHVFIVIYLKDFLMVRMVIKHGFHSFHCYEDFCSNNVYYYHNFIYPN